METTMNHEQHARLLKAVGDAITNEFMLMVPAQPNAQAVKALLGEMLEAATLATAALMPGFEQNPAHYIQTGRAEAAISLERLTKLVLAPGSKAWEPI